MPRPADPAREVDEPLAMTWPWGRVATVVAVLVMVGFWAWIIAGGPAKQNPDRLDDRAYVERSSVRCRALLDDLAVLPNATKVTSAGERADVLDQANVLLSAMVDDLEADAPRTGDDASSVKGWLKDWRTYISNREDYAAQLRIDKNARFLLDANEAGDPVDRPIEIFADLNEMPDCATPGDVG